MPTGRALAPKSEWRISGLSEYRLTVAEVDRQGDQSSGQQTGLAKQSAVEIMDEEAYFATIVPVSIHMNVGGTETNKCRWPQHVHLQQATDS
ncbi:MAG: hypothetical protein H5T33_02755 [Candidatus Methanosuratus sp.]|nr:hypothetical protein [Candidatus Methanosuratincola sp.]